MNDGFSAWIMQCNFFYLRQLWRSITFRSIVRQGVSAELPQRYCKRSVPDEGQAYHRCGWINSSGWLNPRQHIPLYGTNFYFRPPLPISMKILDFDVNPMLTA
jgi:hypothetical protein